MTTWGQLKSEVVEELNLADEAFVTPTEMLGYCRDAIRFAEAEIHKLAIEDRYFESMTGLPLANLKRDYALPSNIYGNKITRMVYVNQNIIYTIERLTNLRRYEDAAYDSLNSVSQSYRYMIVNNDKNVGPRIRLTPTPREAAAVYTLNCTGAQDQPTLTTADVDAALVVADMVVSAAAGVPSNTSVVSVSESLATYTITLSEALEASLLGLDVVFSQPLVQLWFIRQAYVPEADVDIIDIPEFQTFIKQYVKVECIKKEKLNTMLPVELGKLEVVQNQMIATLTEMVPDQDDEIEKDLDIYRWSS